MKKQVSVAYLISGLLFSTCLIVANIVEQKLIQIGPIEATAGLLIFPISYIVNDIIAEVWGYRKARLIIWYGFLMNFLAVAVFRLSILVPGSENFTHQEAFSLVMGNTLRITVASFIAFLIGSFLNAFVMSKMKIMQKGRNFSLRAVVSTLIGEGADSIVFFSIAFMGVIPKEGLVFTILYVLAMATLAFHLLHGFKSAFQSLGINNPKYNSAIKGFGTFFAIVVPVLFAVIPVYIHFFLK